VEICGARGTCIFFEARDFLFGRIVARFSMPSATLSSPRDGVKVIDLFLIP